MWCMCVWSSPTMESISLPDPEAWAAEKVSHSAPQSCKQGPIMASQLLRPGLLSFVPHKYPSSSISLLPFRRLWPWSNAATGRENKEGGECMLLHKCFHRPDYCFLRKETPFIKSVINWHLISRGNKRKVLVKAEICPSTYMNCFPLHA